MSESSHGLIPKVNSKSQKFSFSDIHIHFTCNTVTVSQKEYIVLLKLTYLQSFDYNHDVG